MKKMRRAFSPIYYVVAVPVVYIVLLLLCLGAVVVSAFNLKRAVTKTDLDAIYSQSVFLQRSLGATNFLTAGVLKKTPAMLLYSAASIGQSGVLAARNARVYLNSTLSGDGQTAMLSVDGLNQSVSELSNHLNQFSTDLQKYPGLYNQLSEEQKHKLVQAQQSLASAQLLTQSLPTMTGPGEKRYIILLQNNMELRPTGGFLGSFAHVIFENGAMKDLQVQDIYVPDGQLKGYVEPPYAVKTLLHQTGGWKLRDANWDPDLPTSAQTILWFFEQGGYKDVDGVVSVNLSVAQNLLNALGPINLPDYHETVTAENFYSLVQVETEQAFFPGATNKKDILAALSRALMRELKDLPQDKQAAVGAVLLNAASGRDLAFWFKDSSLQQVVERTHWDGATARVICEQQNCVGDNLYIVESNIGVNKTNCCVNRKAQYDIWIQPDGAVRKTLTLAYENNNPSTPQPPRYYGGGYANYLRIYTNPEASITSVHIDSTPLALTNILGYTWDDIGVHEYGFLAQVEGGEKKTYSVQLSDTQKIDLTHQGVYNLIIQRQPGLRTNAYTIKMHYPADLIRLSTSSIPSATIQDVGVLEFDLTVDKTTPIQFILEPLR